MSSTLGESGDLAVSILGDQEVHPAVNTTTRTLPIEKKFP